MRFGVEVRKNALLQSCYIFYPTSHNGSTYPPLPTPASRPPPARMGGDKLLVGAHCRLYPACRFQVMASTGQNYRWALLDALRASPISATGVSQDPPAIVRVTPIP